MPGAPRQGEIWWANPDPIVGSEIGKRRPVVVMSRNTISAKRLTVIVVPLSSNAIPFPPVSIGVQCMGRSVIAIVDQIKAVDKRRLVEYVEPMEPAQLALIRDALDQLL